MLMTFDFPKLAVWMSWITLGMVVLPGMIYAWYMVKHPNSERLPNNERPDAPTNVPVFKGPSVANRAVLH